MAHWSHRSQHLVGRNAWMGVDTVVARMATGDERIAVR